MTLKFQAVRYMDFSGGQNTRVVNHLMLNSEVRLARNVILDEIGCLKKRLGYTAIGSQIASTAILGNYYFNSSTDANSWHLAVCNVSNSAGIYYNYAGTWTPAGQAGWATSQKVRFESFMDYVFAFNGSDSVQSWSGTGSWGSTNLSGAPNCKYGRVYQDRLYFANEVGNQSRVYYSSDPVSGSINFTTASDWLDVNPEDGQVITALDENSGRLLIFKDNSMFRWNGRATEPDPIIDVGTSSQESVKTINNVTYFFNRYGIYAYDGGMPYLISRKIQEWIDAIDQTKLADVNAEVDHDHYYLAIGDVTVDGTDYSNVWLVYNIPLKAWTVWTLAGESSVMGHYYSSGARYISFGDIDGKIWRINNGNNDGGTAIAVNIQTKQYDIETPEIDKKFTEVYVGTEKAKGLVEVGALIDDDSLRTIGYTEDDDVTKLPSDLMGKKLAITLSESGTGEQWKFTHLIFKDITFVD